MRRAEREHVGTHGNLNLVPLVDILTSIVFFSLLTYTGAALAAMTAFNLSLPPVVVTGEQARASAPERENLLLMLAVKITNGGLRVEHSEGPFRQDIKGVDSTSLAQLQATMTSIKQQFPQNDDVTVIPDDNVSYDDIIHVLDRIRNARFTSIALASRARAEGAGVQNVSNPNVTRGGR